MRKTIFGSCFLALMLLTQVSWGQIGLSNRFKTKQENTFSYNSPREYEIGGIKVEGVKYLDENALISISGLRVGDRIKVPGDAISSAIKNLWKQGILSDVQILVDKIEAGKIYLILRLKERPRLTRYSFEGVKKSRQTELEDKIDLIKGRILTDALVKNTELSVAKYYKNKGYLNVNVTSSTVPDSIITNGVRLIIKVDRKNKVKINNIYFVGNDHFSERKLRSKMKKTAERVHLSLFEDIVSRMLHSKPKDYGKFLTEMHPETKRGALDYLADNANLNFFKTSKLVKKDYEDDLDKIISFYNSKGYRDARILKDTITRHDNSSIDVGIKVFEGDKYYFRNITWTGNFVHDDKTLAKILGVRKGDVYDMDLIQKRLNYNPTGPDVSALYMDNGYLFFHVDPVEVKVENDSIDVDMRVYEGPQATIDEVNIKGNTRTNDHVVLRELRTIPGEKFSREKLIRTQRELSQLGYFNPEKVSPDVVPNPADGTADITWNLEEVSNDQIQLSGGWGGYIGFVGSLGVTFNNFSINRFFDFGHWDPLPVGDGQTLSLAVQANGKTYQNYSASFTEPWLGGKKPNALTVGFSYSYQGQRLSYTSNDIAGYFKIYRGYVDLSRRINWPDNFFTISNSLTYSLYSLNNYGDFGFGANGKANNIILNTTIARNSIDNPIFPRQGSKVSLSVNLTPPYSLFNNINYEKASTQEKNRWVEYNKWMFDASFFTQVVGDLVINTRAHFGYIGSYQKKVGVGPFERFILGGDGITGQQFILGSDIIGLRGYGNNTLMPTKQVISSYDSQGNANVSTLRGGTVYDKFVMEMRYPLSLNPSATIYVLGFAEAGNNWLSPKEFNPFDLKRSAGVGARIFMPAFGTIGIDWGYGFDKDPTTGKTSGGQIHFTIGQQIR